jgi:hypothetical protein
MTSSNTVGATIGRRGSRRQTLQRSVQGRFDEEVDDVKDDETGYATDDSERNCSTETNVVDQPVDPRVWGDVRAEVGGDGVVDWYCGRHCDSRNALDERGDESELAGWKLGAGGMNEIEVMKVRSCEIESSEGIFKACV